MLIETFAPKNTHHFFTKLMNFEFKENMTSSSNSNSIADVDAIKSPIPIPLKKEENFVPKESCSDPPNITIYEQLFSTRYNEKDKEYVKAAETIASEPICISNWIPSRSHHEEFPPRNLQVDDTRREQDEGKNFNGKNNWSHQTSWRGGGGGGYRGRGRGQNHYQQNWKDYQQPRRY